MRSGVFLFAMLGLSALLSPCTAQEEGGPDALRVGISPLAPFVVFPERALPEGYSVDLWRGVALHLDRPFEFVRCVGVAEKLKRVADGEIDVAIGGITVTAEREERVDFTHTHFQTGLDILIPAERAPSFAERLSPLWSRGKLMIIGSFLLLIVISGHLMWIAERGADMFNDRYFPGVFEGMYWAIVTASTVGYGDKAPVKWAGRTLAGIVIVASLPMFALFTAELASSFTVQGMQGNLSGPESLRGQRVGVVEGTTSEDYAVQLHAHTRRFPVVEHAYAALLRGELDAVVYDAPSLNFYAQNEGQGRTVVVGQQFRSQDLALAVRTGNALREDLNRALLKMAESGEIDRLRSKWFGTVAE